MKTRSASYLIAAIAALPVASATAGVITFDPADGYTLGSSLVVHPDWAGDGSLYSVTSLGGGNGAAQSAATNQTNFANNRYTPDAGFLGTPDTTTAGNVYDFSFQIRNDASLGSFDWGVAHRIRIGGSDSAPMIQFQIFDLGVVQYNNGGGSTSVTNINDARFDMDDATGRFITVEGSIDIDAGTYDLSFDGVVQGTGLGLMNVPSDFGQITLQWGPSNLAPDYRQISLDNLAIDAVPVPEPASFGLGLLGMSIVALRRAR
ncbi:PEP-CTERM sorting domain-containing protein [Mucisphaera calidilacus]|uniref:Uncharacterized protein n=1 Tax=Mucisphaera calidilacus TaxID=2527982 RepID=A0A518BU89_9BACT|nr:PEP-CTERM sorting domain-containing protein [Mucisphaera calidilacus]QDU70548.1 hypothetical protein Pan265_03760 [Mucisphaera calidilacus]